MARDAADTLLAACVGHPGGINVVAARMGKKYNDLYNQLKGLYGTKLGLDDAVLIAELTGCTLGLAQAIAGPGGTVLPSDASVAQTSPLGPLAAFARLASDMVVLSNDLLTALDDGRITPNEAKTINKDVRKQIEHLQALSRSLGGDA